MFNRFNTNVLVASLALAGIGLIGCAGELSDEFKNTDGSVSRTDSGAPTAQSDSGGGSDAGTSGQSDSGPSIDIDTVIAKCSAAPGCHGANGLTPDLSEGLDGLTGVSRCNSIPYVTPGDASNSLIYLRVAEDASARCNGQVMPPTSSGGPLSAAEISVVRDYIDGL